MPVIEIPGVGNVEFPDSMSSDEISAAAARVHSQGGGSGAPDTTYLGTVHANRPEGFFETGTAEAVGGLQQITDPTKTNVRKGIESAVTGLGASPEVASGIGAVAEAPDILSNAALGALRIFPGALITALGRKAGEVTQDTATHFGAGPNISAGLATAADMGTQLVGAPYALGKVGSLGLRATQGIARNLPGAQITLREMGKDIIEAFPSALKPPISSKVLYEKVDALNPVVTVPNLPKISKAIAADEEMLAQSGLGNARLAKTAGKMTARTSIETPGGVSIPRALPFKEVNAIRDRIGKRIGELRMKGGEELGQWKQLYKTLSGDLENAANAGTTEAFNLLKDANKAANREFAIGELDDIFNSTIGRKLEGQEFTSSAFAKAYNKIKDMRRSNELFEKGFQEGSTNKLDNIQKTLDELRKIKINPPPKGVNVGSMVLGRQATIGGSIGALIGTAVGVGPGVGAAVGAGVGTGVPWGISRIMQTPAASAKLVSLLKKEGTLSPQQFSALIALTNVHDTTTQQFLTDFKAQMKSKDVPIDAKIQSAMEKDKIIKSEKQAQADLKPQQVGPMRVVRDKNQLEDMSGSDAVDAIVGTLKPKKY